MANDFDSLMNAGEVQDNERQQGESLVLDLGNVDENKPAFEAMPAGTYPVIIENVEFKYSQASNNPMLSWQFKVTDPEFENRMLFYHTVLNKEQGLAALKRLLLRVLPDVSFAEGFNPQQFADEGVAIGYEARVKINIRPYNGQKTNNVQDVLAPESESDFL